MFGYVTAYKPELKMKDFYKYKAYYCGLCKVLKERHGVLGQVTLTYDMTFLVILLASLYEREGVLEEKRCMIHPVKKQKMLYNEYSEYAADMNVLLTYLHFEDDWKDEQSKAGLAGMQLYRRVYRRLQSRYPKKCEVIRDCLQHLHVYENAGEQNLDVVANCFGTLMGELFVYKEDVWEQSLREMGFYLGKYIYILDAYDDVKDDVASGSYNPFAGCHEAPDFDERCKEMLTLVLAECTSWFERLPCIQDVDILRNILYAGVWEKFEKKQLEEEK